MAPHVQRVFGASPGAVGKLLFSAPSFSPLRPPCSWSSFSCPAGPAPLLLRYSGVPSRAIRTLARPTPLLFLHSSSIFQPRPVPPGHLLVRPRYPRYSPRGEKRSKKKKKKEKQEEKGRKTPDEPGVPTKYEIRVCQNGRWRFSLKPMGD